MLKERLKCYRGSFQLHWSFRVFQRSLKRILSKSKVFQESIKVSSRKFEGCFKESVLHVSCYFDWL